MSINNAKNTEQIKKLCREACDLWLTFNAKKKHPIVANRRRHRCGSKCMTHNVRFYAYKLCDGNTHVCLEDSIDNASMCTLGGNPNDHSDVIVHIEHLWVCKRSGRFHLCGIHCDDIIDQRHQSNHINQNSTSNSAFMCQITGIWIATRKDGTHELYGTSASKMEDARVLNWMYQAVELWKKYVYRGWAPVDSSLHTCRSDADAHLAISSVEEEKKERRRLIKGIPISQSSGNTSTTDKLSQNSGACTIVEIPVKVYSMYGSSDYHVCLGHPHCQVNKNDDQVHTSQWINLEHVYVCQETGIPHICGQYCKNSIRNQDGILVCTLTGKCIAEVLIRDTWNVNGAHVMSGKDAPYGLSDCANSGERIQPNKFVNSGTSSASIKMDIDTMMLSGEDAVIDVMNGGMDFNSSNRKSKIEAVNKKQEFLMSAISKIMKLFSDDQLDKEVEKAENIEREINSQLNKYLTKNTQSKRLTVMTDIYLLSLNYQKKKDDFVRFDLSEKDKSNIAMIYAQQCLIFWFIIRTRTKMGREKPNLFLFRDFVYPAITLFETGFEISEADFGYRAVIIEPDPLFQAKAPDLDKLSSVGTGHSHHGNTRTYVPRRSSKNTPPLKKRKMTNSNNSSNISNSQTKPVTHRINIETSRTRSQYDKMRKNIELALTNAVKLEGVSPESLKLNSVEYDGIESSDPAFIIPQSRSNSALMIAAKKQEQLKQITMPVPVAPEVQKTINYSDIASTVPALPPVSSVPYSLIQSSNIKRITFKNNDTLFERLITM